MKEYILKLYTNRINKKNLRSIQSFVTLRNFISKEYFYVSEIYSELRHTRFKAQYKNIHERIQNLLSSKLIENAYGFFPKHNEKYYKLTSNGMIYLLSQLDFDSSYYAKSIYIPPCYELQNIIKNYGNDEFFNIFVYPFIGKDTLLQIKSEKLSQEFLTYIVELCKNLSSKIDLLESVDKDGGFYDRRIYFLDSLTTQDNNVWLEFKEKWLSILKDKFDLQWLEINAKIDKIDDQTLQISHKDHKLDFKISKSDVKIIYNNKILTQYRHFYKGLEDIVLKEFIEKSVEEFIMVDIEKLIQEETVIHLENLGFSVLQNINYEYMYNSTQTDYIKDVKLLANDKKFCNVMKIVKDGFNENYIKFSNHKEMKCDG